MLKVLRVAVKKWEAELIGFRKIVASQAHQMDSETKELDVELSAVKSFIKLIDKFIKQEQDRQAV
tara:strand:+ start:312 stop:506 length:195 start_codon:yes stop_codon:yes gene_type:complete